MDKKINLVLASDDNYAPHLGAAIYSLIYCNSDFEHIKVFIIDNEIREENRRKLSAIVDKTPNTEIIWILNTHITINHTKLHT